MRSFCLSLLVCVQLCTAQDRGNVSRTSAKQPIVHSQVIALRTTNLNLTAGAENGVSYGTIDSITTSSMEEAAGITSFYLYHPGRWMLTYSMQVSNASGSTAIIQIKHRLNGNLISGSRSYDEVAASGKKMIERSIWFDVADADTVGVGWAKLTSYVLTDQASCSLIADSSSHSAMLLLKNDGVKK